MPPKRKKDPFKAPLFWTRSGKLEQDTQRHPHRLPWKYDFRRDPRGGPNEKGEVLAREIEEKERLQTEHERQRTLALQDLQLPPAPEPEIWEVIEPKPTAYEIAAIAMGAVSLLLSAYVALAK